MVLIHLSNDDGIRAPGLHALRRSAMKLGKVLTVAPATQMSAKGKSLTFDVPITYSEYVFADGEIGYGINGTPADTVLVAMHMLKQKPDIVVSGINNGENTSFHSILTSGTCAVAFEAAFNGIRAVAFSIYVPDKYHFTNPEQMNWEPAAKIAGKIIKLALDIDWPKGLAFLNVNFPANVQQDTPIRVTIPSDSKYQNYLIEKTDPRGQTYFWLWGEMNKEFPPNSDSAVVMNRKEISLSPIGFGLKEVNGLFLSELKERIDQL